jgi:hypothetical protein
LSSSVKALRSSPSPCAILILVGELGDQQKIDHGHVFALCVYKSGSAALRAEQQFRVTYIDRCAVRM